MTYIEFYDSTCIENMCASLTAPPDRVVLLGDRSKLLQKQAARYEQILRRRGLAVEFVCQTVSRSSLSEILEVLSALIESDPDCAIDLTGGDELYLVAAGMLYERYPKLRLVRFSIRNNTLQNCDLAAGEREVQQPKLTVEENIQIYGGDVIYETQRPDATFSWDFSGDLAADIDAMWEICKRNVRLWNVQIGVFLGAEACKGPGEDPLSATVLLEDLKAQLEWTGGRYVYDAGIMKGLYKAGLIFAYEDDCVFSITYKNLQVKRCLMKAGQALEMKIYLTALRTREKSGDYVYNDVQNGVCIDWDGEIHPEQGSYDTENEIDVMMMRGLVPVFVSCKNGYWDAEELYKLSAVANRFGGKYAKKVLVTTALADMEFAEYFRERAGDMDIRLVEGVQDMDDPELERTVRSFWCT